MAPPTQGDLREIVRAKKASFFFNRGLAVRSNMALDYKKWIERERRLRLALINDAPQAQGSRGMVRICRRCAEICLCHEKQCPNCGGTDIENMRRRQLEDSLAGHVRCWYRFTQIFNK